MQTEQHAARLYRATVAVASLGAEPGDYVMMEGDRVCLMRERPASVLSEAERDTLALAKRRDA